MGNLVTAAEDEAPEIRLLLDDASSAASSNDFVVALRRYCDAARLGSVEAMYRAGILFADGTGIAHSRSDALELLSMAARQGHQEAALLLEQYAVDLPGSVPECLINPNVELAAAWPENMPLAMRHLVVDESDMTPAQQRVLELVKRLAPQYAIDYRLALIFIALESNFNPAALSPKNAQGLMQLIPATARRFNVRNPFHPEQNLHGGLRYLRWLMSYYQGDVRLVAAAYNAGERAVDRYQGVPPYRETQIYVGRIMSIFPSLMHPFDPKLTEPSPVVKARQRVKG